MVLAALLVVLVVALHHRIQFDWVTFWHELRGVQPLHIVGGMALIYGTYLLRCWRWKILLPSNRDVRALDLLGPQFIGFTAVALFGRLADLVRPYLVARRTGLDVSEQVAVYTLERMFDLGAAAILFSTALAFTPRTLPHHALFVRTGVVSLSATAALALFALAVRAAGGALADALRAMLRRLSQPLAESVATKILSFRAGLLGLRSLREVAAVLALSLAMWSMIGAAYEQSAHAFADTPQLAGLSFARTMLLMGASLGGSLLQLPVLGWFTQIAVTATAMHTLYGAPVETATACGGVLLLVMTLCIIPTGLLWAQLGGVDLKAAGAAASGAVSGKELDGESDKESNRN
ncbi:MAG: flippase-like domain-containing protein [Acidobacteriota bacterium]|nr:flippase-like domain-containing protein [Acidobacteriota bacterium]